MTAAQHASRSTAAPQNTAAPSVALVGAAGHGAVHLRRLAELHDAGRIRLAGVCDVRPVPVPDAVPAFTDHRRLLTEVSPQVLVICTPPHTHLPIALDALRAGCDLLLEKPPVLSLAEHRTLADALAETGRACQVGFQALGSPALAQLTGAIAAGLHGTVTSVAGVGAWWRADAYFERAPWTARRSLDGRPVLDGAVANPFAHALMDCLVIAAAAGGGRPQTLDVERYRVLDLEVEDTACLRLHLAGGLEVTLAVSLRSTEFIPGDVTVTGTGGVAVLEYPTDRLRLPGQPDLQPVPGRVDLLENLLDHRAGRAALLAPLAATAPFTAVIDALAAAPSPQRMAARQLTGHEGGAAIDGIAGLVRRAGDRRALFAELGVPWASGAWRSDVPPV
jgi:predicted dehydrogenase